MEINPCSEGREGGGGEGEEEEGAEGTDQVKPSLKENVLILQRNTY